MMTAQRFSQQPKSPLEGVSDRAWFRFVSALEVQQPGDVSETGGLGTYAMHSWRLVELGYATEHKKGRKKQIEFILPWSKTRFLTDAIAQFAALSKSIVMYHHDLMSGELKKPEGLSVSGAVALLHVGGPRALNEWPKLFDRTREVYDRAKELF